MQTPLLNERAKGSFAFSAEPTRGARADLYRHGITTLPDPTIKRSGIDRTIAAEEPTNFAPVPQRHFRQGRLHL